MPVIRFNRVGQGSEQGQVGGRYPGRAAIGGKACAFRYRW